jgi:spermidine/putrescine transport system permease protein
MIVKARLTGLEKSYVEAAKDLGAGEWRAFFDITLPLILPAVVSGMLIAFAMSFDDVIVSVFVTGPTVNTLPIRIFTQMKTGVTPKTNALCALLFVATIALCLASAALDKFRKNDQ